MALKYDITIENLKVIEIRKIFLNKDNFGPLIFEKSYETVEKTRKMLVELKTLGYAEKLTPEEVREIDNDIKGFVGKIAEVAGINMKTDPNFNTNSLNNLEQNILRQCEQIQIRLRNKLVFLRQEMDTAKPNQKDLQKERVELQGIRLEYESSIKALKEEINELKTEKETIENAHGEIAAVKFGKHFEEQASIYDDDAKTWLEKRRNIIWTFFAIIFINLGIYLYSISGHNPAFTAANFFTQDYAIIKLALVLLLSHLLAFNSKNYSISKNLAASNKHRKNVAETMNSFLEANPGPEIRSQIINQGTQAMFKAENSGYLGKINIKDHSPIEQINYIMPKKD